MLLANTSVAPDPPDVHVLVPCMLPCTIFWGCEDGLDCSNEHAEMAVEDIHDAEDGDKLDDISRFS